MPGTPRTQLNSTANAPTRRGPRAARSALAAAEGQGEISIGWLGTGMEATSLVHELENPPRAPRPPGYVRGLEFPRSGGRSRGARITATPASGAMAAGPKETRQ